jgi:hypothetical protein
MQLDDSKYKVYIYNIDDELSSESEPEDGKLVFLPDIEKHLRTNRIPQHVLAKTEGEPPGMELVLYSVPSSISVPAEQDSVRKAVIEARARLREKQKEEREAEAAVVGNVSATAFSPNDPPVIPDMTDGFVGNGPRVPAPAPSPWAQQVLNDPDAMDLS